MIYAVIIEGDDSHVKIGKTKGPVATRLRSLQTSSPRLLICIATCDGYTKEEAEIHYQFRASRSRGEWFVRSMDVNAWIDRHALPVPVGVGLRQPKRTGRKVVKRHRSKVRRAERWSAEVLSPPPHDPFRAAAAKQIMSYR